MSTVSHALARHLPARMLGLGEDDLTAESVRDRLQTIGQRDPEAGHELADSFMRTALQVIADGHPRPDEIASYAVIVCSAEFPRWYA